MGALTDFAIRAAKPGRYHDGEALTLRVKSNGSKFWVLRVMKDGKRTEIGLGGYPGVSLAAARTAAAVLRDSVKTGVDVLAAKRAEKEQAKEASERTFRKVAKLAHAQRNGLADKTNALWLARLERFVFPHFGDTPVDKVDGAMVIKALDPIWNEKPETARRVRRAISSVLKYANSRQWRGPVPILSDLTKDAFAPHASGPVHHPAVQYPDAPAVVALIDCGAETVGRLALLFTIFTAARSGETRGATWGEIDLEKAEWTIPAARMKMKRDHVVPLSDAAIAILSRILVLRPSNRAPNALVFPGQAKDRPLSDMTMAKVHKLAAPATVPHGWRSTFRDWAGEETAHSSDVCEAALAHVIGNATTRSYQRGTMLDKRRALMNDWAAYLAPV